MKVNLTELANKYGTDKGTTIYESHNYTSVYADFFEGIFDKKIKLLEIGVYDIRFPGASVQMWNEYFSNLEHVGFDINESSKNLESFGVKIFIGDQNNEVDLKNLIQTYGGDYDIVIDDGYHMHSHHITSFVNILPHLKSGGLYFIEDLHANDSYKTIEWFSNNKIPYKLFLSNKLLVYEKP